ncbi:MAG: cellulase family glycosylhydrolase [Victivallales bacterium]|nr:cellulase family glycosylhydrolase [Victivallales bacterium]
MIFKRLSAIAAGMMMMAGAFCASGANAEHSPFLVKKGNKLYLNGQEYRAIGVNMPNLSQSYLGTWHHNKQIYKNNENARNAIIAGVEAAAKAEFKFIRFFASPGYAYDMDLLYMKDRDAYWKGMDEVFELCRKNNLRLVPCLNAAGAVCNFHEYYGEPRQAVLDPNSKTYKAVHEYMHDFVTRYKDDPVVLMWELQNEGMLKADIDRKGKERNKDYSINRDKKKLPPYTREDSITFDMLVKLYKDHAAYIKSIDKNHLVTSGDVGVRPDCSTLRKTFPNAPKKREKDSLAKQIKNNILSQPKPLDVFSYHFYGSLNSDKKNDQTCASGIYHGPLNCMMRLCRESMATGRPVFVGELEVAWDQIKNDPEQVWTQKFIDMAEKQGISLIALWVWHFPWQPEMTMSSETYPALVKRCAEFNRKYAAHGDLK